MAKEDYAIEIESMDYNTRKAFKMRVSLSTEDFLEICKNTIDFLAENKIVELPPEKTKS